MTPAETVFRTIAECAALSLATLDDDGHPAIGYVPFAPVDGAFGIAVSALAAHARHLYARPDAAVLLTGRMASGADAYARPRLSVAVRARRAASESTAALAVWNALAKRHGETVATLRSLPDFTTFRLEPVRGRAILGFAAAVDLDGSDLARALA